MIKGYTIGFSSGMFYTAEAGEKESFLTMPRKFFKGSLEGVTFTQVDIESITEFTEPNLKKGIERMKDLGLRIGFHGESYAMGGVEKPIGMLDSSIESDYNHAHQRLIQHIEGCGSLGGEFVNIHPSETTPYIKLDKDLQAAKLVDPWGRPFRDFLKENPKILEWAVDASKKELVTAVRLRAYARSYKDSFIDALVREKTTGGKELTREDLEQIDVEAEDRAYRKALLDFVDSNDLEYGAEKVSYQIIAKWMQMNNDPLWRDIVGGNIPDKKLDVKNREWVPAVSAKYIWGHFNPKDTSRFKDPKPLLQKYNMYFVFETQMGSSGLEGLQRLSRPRDMIFLCKSIGSDKVGVCFDFEHVLSQNIKPEDEIKTIPFGSAGHIKVCHLGWPTPHVPAHMPVPVGSEAHLYLYERLFELRKKGMKNGYFIFERAGAGRETTIIALRLIKQFLEKDIEPKKLPLQFFGMDEKGPDIIRQEVAIRDHFFDPLKGMLSIPEEEYTFLSKTATEKGKAEVWKKEQFR